MYDIIQYIRPVMLGTEYRSVYYKQNKCLLHFSHSCKKLLEVFREPYGHIALVVLTLMCLDAP